MEWKVDDAQSCDGLFASGCRQRNIGGDVGKTSWRTTPFIHADEVIAPAERIPERAHVSAAGEREVVRMPIRYLETALNLIKSRCKVVRLAD